MSNGINIDLTANVARFSSSLDRATQDLSRFQTNTQRIGGSLSSIFAGLGVGLSVAGFAGLIKSSIDAADNLRDLSKTTGITVEDLSGLQLAAKQSGTQLDDVAGSVNKLAVNMGKNSEKFRQLGIDANDPLEAFKQLADVFVSIKDPQERAALGAAALGKSWQETAPLLSEGGQAIGEMVAKGRELSGMTTEFAEQSDQFNDQLEIMKTQLSGVAVRLAGPILDGFNQLIHKLDDATEHGITLNNVLTGLADFAFDQTTFTGVAGELQSVNKELDNVEKKIALMRNNSAIGGLLDDIAGNDINLELNKRDALIKKQEALFEKLQGAAPEKKAAPLAQGDVKKFLGTEQGDREKASRAPRIKQIIDETKQFDELIKRQRMEIDLRGVNTEAARVEYQYKNGFFDKATEQQQIKLMQLAEEGDALDRLKKQQDAIVESAREFSLLRGANKDLIQSDNVQSGFNDALARNRTALDTGVIDEEQFKAEMDALAKAYNSDFIDPSKSATNELSDFAVEAAHNMQDSFADFLFDPFSKGLDGMLIGFLNVIRRMVAEQASAALLGGKGGGSGILGTILSSVVGGVAGSFGSAGSSAAGGIIDQGFAKSFAGFKGFASGGDFGGGWRIVGERGAELEATGSARIFNVDQTKKILSGEGSGGGGIINNVTINVQSSGNESPSSLGQKIGEAFVRAIAREEITTANRPGNSLNKSTSFG